MKKGVIILAIVSCVARASPRQATAQTEDPHCNNRLIQGTYADYALTEIAHAVTFNGRSVCPGTLPITPGTDLSVQELDPEVLMRPVGFAPRWPG